MQVTQFLPLLLLVAFAAYAFWMMKKRKQGLQNLGPAFQRFFEQTGYRHAELGGAPLEEHVRLSEEATRQLYRGAQKHEMHLVRDFHGLEVHHDSYIGAPQSKSSRYQRVMWCRWSVALAQPPRVLWQVADKTLGSMGKAVMEAFSNTTREWSPLYPHRIPTGDRELDKRFVVYGEDPEAVVRVMATPGLKELLLGCAEVDLSVERSRAVFSDPSQKNMLAAMGGTVGAMAVGFDYGKYMDLTIPVHERITELLALSLRASQ